MEKMKDILKSYCEDSFLFNGTQKEKLNEIIDEKKEKEIMEKIELEKERDKNFYSFMDSTIDSENTDKREIDETEYAGNIDYLKLLGL